MDRIIEVLEKPYTQPTILIIPHSPHVFVFNLAQLHQGNGTHVYPRLAMWNNLATDLVRSLKLSFIFSRLKSVISLQCTINDKHP